MLYYLFEYLKQIFDFPGDQLLEFLSVRSALAIMVSLLISWVFGGTLIKMLRKKQVGETIRDLGLEGQLQKQGTPTMGGLIIIAAISIPVLLFAKLENHYILLLLLATIWMGIVGFIDDYIKVFRKNKKGLAGRFKIIGQIGLGLIVASVMFYSPQIVVRQEANPLQVEELKNQGKIIYNEKDQSGEDRLMYDAKSCFTTIPFVKTHAINYCRIIPGNHEILNFLLFAFVVVFIVTAVSNAANLTDGIDGLATGTSAIIGLTLGILAYLSGNSIFSDYLNILYLPNTAELLVFSAAFIGACIGFLWYNAYPAKVFMGDTGSLALGGIIASFAVLIRKELLIPLLCGIFVLENLSVVMQVAWFKYTKRKYGEGRRIFLMSPLHHHYQKKGMHEAKIVSRFWIVGIMLAVLTFITLKVR